MDGWMQGWMDGWVVQLLGLGDGGRGGSWRWSSGSCCPDQPSLFPWLCYGPDPIGGVADHDGRSFSASLLELDTLFFFFFEVSQMILMYRGGLETTAVVFEGKWKLT